MKIISLTIAIGILIPQLCLADFIVCTASANGLGYRFELDTVSLEMSILKSKSGGPYLLKNSYAIHTHNYPSNFDLFTLESEGLNFLSNGKILVVGIGASGVYCKRQ